MTNLYFINDGSNNNAGWCTSMREAKSTRASLVATCGSEYQETAIETHTVREMHDHTLSSVSRSTSAPIRARRVAQRELDRRSARCAGLPIGTILGMNSRSDALR